MKTLISFLGAAAMLALSVGCQNSTSSSARLQEKSASLASLSTEDQKKLEQGLVEVGYTADMVYVALGRPNKVSVTADGTVGIWTYTQYLPSEGVSNVPFYAIAGGYRGRPAFRSGPSEPGGHASPSMAPVGRGSPQGGPPGMNWSNPNVSPVTLHVMFTRGRVIRFAMNDGA